MKMCSKKNLTDRQGKPLEIVIYQISFFLVDLSAITLAMFFCIALMYHNHIVGLFFHDKQYF